MNNGIVIVALGYSIYGKMAFNLAMSLKTNDPDCRIAVLCNDTALLHLRACHLKYFDYLIKVPATDYTINGQTQFQRVKLKVYDYTPFDNTIYMDADSLWCPNRKVAWLFGELANVEYTTMPGGYYDIERKQMINQSYTFWGDRQKIIDYHKLTGKFYQTQSTFFYFKKTERIKQFFETALQVYDDQKAPSNKWANGKPDEYCFNVAGSLCKVFPHNNKYRPVFLFLFEKIFLKQRIIDNYWAISTCGHKVHSQLQAVYNDLLNRYCRVNDIPDRFYHENKAELIPERKAG